MNFLPAIKQRSSDLVELSIPLTLRAFYMGLGAMLIWVLQRTSTGRPFAIMFAIVIAIIVLSDDKWIFDTKASKIRRITGLLFFAKRWSIDYELVSSVEVNAEYNLTDTQDPYSKVNIGGAKKSALRLVFNDGRSLVVCAAKQKWLQELQKRGAAIAATMGKPLIET